MHGSDDGLLDLAILYWLTEPSLAGAVDESHFGSLSAFDDSSFDDTTIGVPSCIASGEAFRHHIDKAKKKAPGRTSTRKAACRRASPEREQPEHAAQQCLPGLVPTQASGSGPPVAKQSRAHLYDLVAAAYAEVSEGFSTDRVLLEPIANAKFVQRCWRAGAQASPFELNWALMNARKAGRLSSAPPAERFSMDRSKLDMFGFASEFALRLLQERYYYEQQIEISLDQMLCDPSLAAQFDELARQIRPGFSAFEYRWAALLIRKAMRSIPKPPRMDASAFERIGPTDDVRVLSLPTAQGLYRLARDERFVYVGIAHNLRDQIDQLLQSCGSRLTLPGWNAAFSDPPCLAILSMPTQGSSAREQLKAQWVPLLKPRLNYVSGRIGSLLAVA